MARARAREPLGGRGLRRRISVTTVANQAIGRKTVGHLPVVLQHLRQGPKAKEGTPMPKGMAKGRGSPLGRRVFTKWFLPTLWRVWERRSTVFGSCLLRP
jgi:hypothetical protein